MPYDYNPEALSEAEADIRSRLIGEPVDIEVQRAISNLYRAATVVSRSAEREILAKDNLSWSAFVMLWVLWVWGEMDSTRLAAEVGLTPGTITGVRKGLERDGWIESRRGQDDGRRVMVKLTDDGEARFSVFYPEFNAWSAHRFGALSADDTTSLADLLQQVILAPRTTEDDRTNPEGV